VLAGGAGRRLGGADKPLLVVNGRPMLHRVLDAVADAAVRVVVGPRRHDLPPDVLVTSEDPVGGGPAAATAAGLAALPAEAPERVALLAADLPWLTAVAVGRLLDAIPAIGGTGRGADDPQDPIAHVDGAVYLDDNGRRQLLCGAWRRDSLARRLAEIGEPAGASMRTLFSGLSVVELLGDDPAWFDCDTDEDLRVARERWGS
jgi:molybdopterin-guanine dinucleotide biosynthesis protein A